jgi:hypothetical protein
MTEMENHRCCWPLEAGKKGQGFNAKPGRCLPTQGNASYFLYKKWIIALVVTPVAGSFPNTELHELLEQQIASDACSDGWTGHEFGFARVSIPGSPVSDLIGGKAQREHGGHKRNSTLKRGRQLHTLATRPCHLGRELGGDERPPRLVPVRADVGNRGPSLARHD